MFIKSEKNMFNQALQYHGEGNLEAAAQIYRELLKDDPDNADANNLLGAVHCQKGELHAAMELIRKAISKHPERGAYYVNLGVAHENSGQLEEAEQCYRKALELSPDEPQAMFNLANCLLGRGKPDEAAELYREVIRLVPENLGAYLQLGMCHTLENDFTGAAQVFEKALEIAPGDEHILFNLALCFRRKEEFRKAGELLERILVINPGNEAARLELGNNFFDQRRYMEAARCFQLVLEGSPEDLLAKVNFANCLLKQGDLAEAERLYREVLAKDASFVLAHYNLGQCYLLRGQYKEAEAVLRKALDANPDHAKAREMLAKILAVLGSSLWAQGLRQEAMATYNESLAINENSFETLIDMCEIFESSNRLDDAWEYIQRLLEIAPDDPRVNINAAVILRRKGDIQGALDRLSRIDIPEYDARIAARMMFELGRLYDRTGQYDKAFESFTLANRFRIPAMEQLGADKDRFLNDLEKVAVVFAPENLTSFYTDVLPPASDDPTFLVGFPRSGTTLIDQILDSHPKLQVMEEKLALDETVKEIDREFGGIVKYPESVLSYDESHVLAFREKYRQLAENYVIHQEGAAFIDKMPLQIINLGLIKKVFPGTKIILVIRHPYDACLSNFMQDYQLNDAMANFMTLEDAALFYDRVMSLWQYYEKNLQLDYHMIRYEDLVDDFAGEQKKLLNFLGLEPVDDGPAFYEHARSKEWISTPSYQQVTEPIYTRAKYRWKSYEKYFEPLKPLLDKYVDYFGYADKR